MTNHCTKQLNRQERQSEFMPHIIHDVSRIAIFGMSVLIGKRLISELIRDGVCEIRVIPTNKQRNLRKGRFGQAVEVFEGNISNPVSDDDDRKNNLIDLKRFLMGVLCVKEYRLPKLTVPLVVIKLILKLLGRDNVNPCCDFDPSKLCKLGFRNPLSLREGFAEYATWYRASHLGEKGQRAS